MLQAIKLTDVHKAKIKELPKANEVTVFSFILNQEKKIINVCSTFIMFNSHHLSDSTNPGRGEVNGKAVHSKVA